MKNRIIKSGGILAVLFLANFVLGCTAPALTPTPSPTTPLATSPTPTAMQMPTSTLATPTATVAPAPKTALPLDPNDIEKYAEPLVIPPAMPQSGSTPDFQQYEIAVREFEQQVLPPPWPKTEVWGYGAVNSPPPGEPGSTFNWPGFTIETRSNEKVRVNWINGLVDEKGDYLPHLLPVDPTLHWANPPGPQDTRLTFTGTPGRYTGPVPIVTHVHGAHVESVSDGHPEAWYLPDAKNIPAGYVKQGTHYGSVLPAPPGEALFEYRNDQRAATLWYHDHSLGMTRLNVYTGLAGFWLIRDDIEDGLNLPGPAPRLGDAAGTKYYEVPIAIQDRSFNEDGTLFYPDTREFFDEFAGPYIGTDNSDVSPIWNPEFFGNAMTANGKTWPYLEVEPRLYRLRLLNGCNSRFLILKFDREGLPFHQIGTEGGLLPATVELDELLIAPAERADVLVDFSGFVVGTEIVLLNLGPDEPFGGGIPGEDFESANPDTTGQVMMLKIVGLTGNGNPGTIPGDLPAVDSLNSSRPDRDLTLNEEMSGLADIPTAAELGTNEAGRLEWMDDVTENPQLNDTEVWRFINLTEDAHPIHLHMVMFQVVERVPFEDIDAYVSAQEAWLAGTGPMPIVDNYLDFEEARGPEAWESGWKDTVIAYPEEVTRIIAKFDIAGLYVWHCHILEHEDNEMMRPYMVEP